MSSKVPGFENLFKATENTIEKKCDCVVVLIHWALTLKNDFKVIGLGKDKTFTAEDVENPTESLPEGWNTDDVYSIRYVFNNELFILSANKSDDLIIINLLHHKPNTKPVVKSISIDLDEYVKEIKGNIKKMIPEYAELIKTIQTDLIDKSTGISSSSGEVSASSSNESRRIEPQRNFVPPDYDYDPLRVGPPRQPPRFGRGDIDPFAPDNERGMLFNIPRFRPPPAGPGRHPDARFYPYGPDNDEFRPPF